MYLDRRVHSVKAYHSLPEGYQEIMQINLQKDKQTAKKVNIIASIVMVVLLVAGDRKSVV